MANVFTDALFSSDVAVRDEKIGVARSLRKSFNVEINDAMTLLFEYDHLVEHDDF